MNLRGCNYTLVIGSWRESVILSVAPLVLPLVELFQALFGAVFLPGDVAAV